MVAQIRIGQEWMYMLLKKAICYFSGIQIPHTHGLKPILMVMWRCMRCVMHCWVHWL